MTIGIYFGSEIHRELESSLHRHTLQRVKSALCWTLTLRPHLCCWPDSQLVQIDVAPSKNLAQKFHPLEKCFGAKSQCRQCNLPPFSEILVQIRLVAVQQLPGNPLTLGVFCWGYQSKGNWALSIECHRFIPSKRSSLQSFHYVSSLPSMT